MLEFNQYQYSDKARFIVYADLECLTEKIGGYKNNPENSSRTKVSKHVPSSFSMFTMLSFKSIENKHGVNRGNDSMKGMKLLTKEQQESNKNSTICYICKEKIENKV